MEKMVTTLQEISNTFVTIAADSSLKLKNTRILTKSGVTYKN